MDTNTEAALSVAHQNLSDDLEKLAQLIEPVNDRAIAMVSKVHRRLRDIQELAKFTTKGDAAIEGLVGGLPEDTLAAVSDTLVVLTYVDWQDGGSCGDNFACGMLRILNCAIEALGYEVGRVGTLRTGAKS